jgi:hypothetical protein
MSALMQHPDAGYAYLPGGATFSEGIVTLPGYAMTRVVFCEPLHYRQGFERASAVLRGLGLTMRTVCGAELRIERPLSLDGFAQLNHEYVACLDSWGLRIGDESPITRTNIAVERPLSAQPLLYAFSYVHPQVSAAPAFLTAGTGEIDEHYTIVAQEDHSAAGIGAKVDYVIGALAQTLLHLEVDASNTTHIHTYTRLPLAVSTVNDALFSAFGSSFHGIRWFHERPPVESVAFEMDLRRIVGEQWLE